MMMKKQKKQKTESWLDICLDVDVILQEQKGICFDYAALMTAMLRSSGIPTVLISDMQRIFIMHGSVPILKKQAFL